ncbi:unnamed protein product [Ranitomeya imitator]|uniref:Uncharacterized protein n=1 Tax=Ranitomeya imitator TaxID=111125 RepID=A0ABN9M8I0_9NEOB|nr:unnamed protein product [Ranitomeya imitator]
MSELVVQCHFLYFSRVSALSPLVWLLYSSIDHLLQALEENNSRLNHEERAAVTVTHASEI